MSQNTDEFANVSIPQIKARSAQMRAEINKHRPMFNSSWSKRIYDDYTSSHLNDEHHHIVSTLFSGGTLRAPVYYYLELLKKKADDICRGVIFTDNELVHDVHTFHVFFELDYRGIIPSFSTMMKHVRMAQELFKQAYPIVDSTLTVSTSDKKVRKNKKTGTEEACFGVHLVFSNSATICADLKRLCGTLDIRISKDDPVWSGVVDSAAVHAHHASLRPNFSHKMEACELCESKNNSVTEIQGAAVVKTLVSSFAQIKNGKKKKKYSHYSRLWKEDIVTDDDEDDWEDGEDGAIHFYEAAKNTDILGSSLPSVLNLASCGQCFGGRLISPSSYRLELILNHDGTVNDYTADGKHIMSVHDELKMCSIQRQDIDIQKPFSLSGDLPSDFVGLLDVQPPKHGAIFTAEKKVTRNWARKKNTNYLSMSKDIYMVLQPLLRRLHGNYTDCELQNIILDSDSNNLIINVKGKGSRYCPLIGREHHSNRAFFMISLRTGYLHVKCFDQNCKKRRDSILPSKKRKLDTVNDPEANRICKIISTRLPDTIWEQLCVAVNVPYRNNSYTARPKIQISPATQVTLMTTNPHRIQQEKQKKLETKQETAVVSHKIDLLDFSGNSTLSSLLAGFK